MATIRSSDHSDLQFGVTRPAFLAPAVKAGAVVGQSRSPQ
jgi:hypothetical protein